VKKLIIGCNLSEILTNVQLYHFRVYSASYVFSKTYVINPALSYDSTQYNIAQNIKTTNIADNIKY